MPALSMPASLLHTVFEHKAWANQDLLQILQASAVDEADKRWRLAIRLMNHLFVVDQIFIAHLRGVAPGYSGTNTPETPTLAELAANTQTSDRWLLDFIASSPANEFERVIDFTFTDGLPGRMNVGEILMHLSTHASYHRGMIGRILSEEKVTPPRDILTGFLHLDRDARLK